MICARYPVQPPLSLCSPGALSAGVDPRFVGNTPADLAQLARPRYHIAGGQSVFYTRLPYANPDLGAGPRATRFVSLGSVLPRLKLSTVAAAAAADAAAVAASAAVAQEVMGPGGPTAAAAAAAGAAPGGSGRGRAGIGHDPQAAMAAAAASTAAAATAAATAVAEAAKQQKFLHALALVPASSMSIEQLGTLPDGCGEDPYEKQLHQVGQKRSSTATYEHVSNFVSAPCMHPGCVLIDVDVHYLLLRCLGSQSL